VYALDLAQAHIDDLRRAATKDHWGTAPARRRLRRRTGTPATR
jgi:hypothetical protein